MPFENLEKEQPSIGCSFLLYRKLVVSYKAKKRMITDKKKMPTKRWA